MKKTPTLQDIETFTGNMARVFVPFGIAFLVLLSLSAIHGFDIMPKLLSIYAFYSLPIIDVIPAFALGLGLGIGYYTVSIWLFTAEMCEALFVAWNFDHLYKFKWFKKKVKKSRLNIFEKYVWFFDFRHIAVIFITILPFAASGSIVAPIVGRILGLSVKETMLGVGAGSVIRFAFFILITKGIITII